MAKVLPGFDAGSFREGIRTAMIMSLPVEAARRPQFVSLVEPTRDGAADADGVPWDIAAPMVRPAEAAVRVPCAIEMGDRSEETRQFGPLQPGFIEITLLDEDYVRIEGFSYVNIWPTHDSQPVRYVYRRVLMQPNLDEVGVWVLECATEDTV